MTERKNAGSLSALIRKANDGTAQCSYFVRLAALSPEDAGLVAKLRRNAAVLRGSLPNPDTAQLDAMKAKIGEGFCAEREYIVDRLGRWLPRLSTANRTDIAQALCMLLDEQRANGKSSSILQNIYTKLLWWLSMVTDANGLAPTVIAVNGNCAAHELLFFRMLNAAGTDIILIEPEGDAAYGRRDPENRWSELLPGFGGISEAILNEALRKDPSAQTRTVPVQNPVPPRPVTEPPVRPGMTAQNDPVHAGNAARPGMNAGQRPGVNTVPPKREPYTPHLTLYPGRTDKPEDNKPHLTLHPEMPKRDTSGEEFLARCFPKSSYTLSTNTWMKGTDYTNVRLSQRERSDDFTLLSNCFIRVEGTPDKLGFPGELFTFAGQLRTANKRLTVQNMPMPLPKAEEVSQIRRRPYTLAEEMIGDMAYNLPICADGELAKLLQRAFAESMMLESRTERDLHKLLIEGVYLLCRLRRLYPELLHGYKPGHEMGILIAMGGCDNVHDALFLRCCARLPLDVLIFAPDKTRRCMLEDDLLAVQEERGSMPVFPFPTQAQTVASGAEAEINTVMGRRSTPARAQVLTLRTAYDEIKTLWKSEIRFRPGYSEQNGTVTMPVLFAQVSGVERRNTTRYWQNVRSFWRDDCYLYTGFPLEDTPDAKYTALARRVLRNGHLQREILKSDVQYPFGQLREELQEHVLDTLEGMLESRTVRGTGENGAEYTVTETVLSLRKELLRMLQSFNFRGKNPKILVAAPGEERVSVRDAALLAFLHLAGFDVVLFVPTGYATIAPLLHDCTLAEHQAGEFLYELQMPDLSKMPNRILPF